MSGTGGRMEKGVKMDNKYYIVRAKDAGVFFGKIKRRNKHEVEMKHVRKLWYWDGAAAVEQLAVDGVKNPKDCKFTVFVDQMVIADPIQIIHCTDRSEKILKEVEAWKI